MSFKIAERVLLLFSMACSSVAFSADSPEDIWQYTVSVIPNQEFRSFEEAEAALLGYSEDFAFFQIDELYTITDTTIEIKYHIPVAKRIPKPWEYYQPNAGLFGYDTETSLMAALEAHAAQGDCSATLTPTSE